MKKIRFVVVLVIVSLFITSCSFPFLATPQPPEVAPNLTLTALFDTSLHIPPTITPPSLFETPVVNTPVPGTPVPNTAIPTAAPTNTPYTIVVTATSAPSLVPTYTPYVIVVTATKVPPTATKVPKQRAGTQMEAGYLDNEPVMDGSYEEWLGETNKYKLPYVVWGGSSWSDQEDLEGAYAAAWDENYLYISVKVTDDKYVQNQTGAFLYKGDSIEILLDTDLLGDFYTQYLDYDDFQIGVSAGTKGSDAVENYLWYPKSSAGSKSKILMGSMFESGPVYRIEVGIPWSMLGIQPYKGMRLGFAVSVNDNDLASEDVQQSMISTARYRNFLDPTTWGELILTW